jgi:hypothetical protein
MFSRNRISAAALATLMIVAPVHAQYGDGLPAVRTPPAPPVVAKPNIGAAFAAAYQQAGRPRIAIFWNRALSDDTNAQYETYDRTVTDTEDHQSSSSDNTATESGGASISNTDRLKKVTTDRVTGSRMVSTDDSRSDMAESTAWRIESSFYNPFLTAGARFIDRNMAMRTVHGGKRGTGGPDVVALETSALLGKADLLMEVLMSPDGDSPIGCRFRVTVKDVKSGQIIGLLSTRAIPPTESHTRYVAAPTGFQKVTTRATPNLEEFAQRLAEETMVQLMRSWNHPI